MKNWNKKNVSRLVTKELYDKYGIPPLTASVFVRRGITDGEEIQYYLETDKRFLHNPFMFSNMTDAVERIIQAKEEEEKVLIFGDRDVDGITSTTVLYNCLKGMGIDVTWRLPGTTDPYGLNMQAVDDFAKNYGTLIITVDCGISNNEEIAHAAELGIDVIVADHHNPPAELPSPAIIINPKCEDSGYPFKDISGCAVAYKLCSALRFSASELYRNEVVLMSVRPVNDAYTIECIKTENLVETDSITETIIPGTVSFTQTRLEKFLRGHQIFVWDKALTLKMLSQVFGNGIEFEVMDMQPEVAKAFPQLARLSLMRLKNLSRLARYNPSLSTEIQGFFNIFVTFMTKSYYTTFKNIEGLEERDLQLVALAALADIMPLKNENRIFLKHGIASLNAGHAREGLVELLSRQQLLGKRISSTDLSWNIVPVLNSCGRLGRPELGVELFTESNAEKRQAIADEILNLNSTRKQLGTEGWNYALESAEESIRKYSGKLCVVIDERINRGISGIVAGKLVSQFNVPSMAVTFVDDCAIGSMRSCRGFSVTPFLDQMSDIFINHGGHDLAAGFSFKKERLNDFLEKLSLLAPAIDLLESDTETYNIDAEIPHEYLNPDLIKTVDTFEPYGEQNPKLTFMSKNLKVLDARLIGKAEPYHLKLTLESKGNKWPALFWNEGERLNRDFKKDDYIDVLYELERNTFNGMETLQLIIRDIAAPGESE